MGLGLFGSRVYSGSPLGGLRSCSLGEEVVLLGETGFERVEGDSTTMDEDRISGSHFGGSSLFLKNLTRLTGAPFDEARRFVPLLFIKTPVPTIERVRL